jgi:hypothetical protein
MPGPGHTMIAMPAAIESSPLRALAGLTRASMPDVSIAEKPSKMNSAPMNVARLLTLQSMLKISTPATIRTAPFRSSRHQLRASVSATLRVSLCPSDAVPGSANILVIGPPNHRALTALLRCRQYDPRAHTPRP